MANTAEVNFSQLVQHPRETIENMRTSGTRALRLSRRDAEDLVLMWASRAAQEDQIVDVATRLFTALLRTEDGLQHMTAALPEVFPLGDFPPRRGHREIRQGVRNSSARRRIAWKPESVDTAHRGMAAHRRGVLRPRAASAASARTRGPRCGSGA